MTQNMFKYSQPMENTVYILVFCRSDKIWVDLYLWLTSILHLAVGWVWS